MGSKRQAKLDELKKKASVKRKDAKSLSKEQLNYLSAKFARGSNTTVPLSLNISMTTMVWK